MRFFAISVSVQFVDKTKSPASNKERVPPAKPELMIIRGLICSIDRSSSPMRTALTPTKARETSCPAKRPRGLPTGDLCHRIRRCTTRASSGKAKTRITMLLALHLDLYRDYAHCRRSSGASLRQHLEPVRYRIDKTFSVLDRDLGD